MITINEDNLFYMGNNKPLATRMRPNSVSEIVGQNHILGEGKVLSRMVKSNQISSIILYGPPGIGKTSIAQALANDFNIKMDKFNASIGSRKELQDILKFANPTSKKIILVDEIHRLTKPNQDLLLKYIEDGSIILVGATTENPYMSIVPALRSRTNIFELNPIDSSSITKLLAIALEDKVKGLGKYNVETSEENLAYLASKTNGDARVALNTLELAVKSTEANEAGQIIVDPEVIDSCLQSKQIGGDKDGDTHYNLLSAFQKSIRGSDVDASLHYLARLIDGGDLLSILRRLIVISYEDIGFADNTIHSEVLDAVEACERVGLPEARIPLSYIVIRLALSRKSNVAYKAISNATNAIYSNKDLQIPESLHDTHYKGASSMGKGIGYKYPHNYKHSLVSQQYLPKDFSRDKYLEFRDSEDTKHIQSLYNDINNSLNK